MKIIDNRLIKRHIFSEVPQGETFQVMNIIFLKVSYNQAFQLTGGQGSSVNVLTTWQENTEVQPVKAELHILD